MPTTGEWSIEELGAIVEASLRKALKKRDEKQSVHLSDMNSEQKHRILTNLALKVNVLELEEPLDTSIPGYKWIVEYTESHEDQRAQYMAYLKTHLTSLLEKFSLVHIANDESVLDTEDPRLAFGLHGTADVLLVRANAPQESERKHVNQTIGQLVCASIKAPLECYPMSLLTDLNGVWLFSYLSDKNVLTHVEFHYPKNAIDFIKATIVDPPEGAILPLPYLAVPFKKMRVDDFYSGQLMVDGYATKTITNP
ncbi:hypothetical protein AC1031_020823 [Aphanomyces cochlioides]|nr:hypothetical protein AC1031_020823 [Aphanomyces cochlioides]